MTAREVEIDFITGFPLTGRHRFSIADGVVNDNGASLKAGEIEFRPTAENSVFEVADVVIGIGFHWQRREPQRFRGSLRLLVDGDDIILVNDVAVEDYLRSVISSEMSANASQSLLKAHAVISRSWVLSQIDKTSVGDTSSRPATDAATGPDGHATIIKWYDREDHRLFDVCADDHCQRYQGITRQTTPAVDIAVNETRGEVLTSDGALCDARFSKCCGGITEDFATCWDDRSMTYLAPVADDSGSKPAATAMTDADARQWILSRPESFCANPGKEILAQVLNNYDRETTDFYRWKVTIDSIELGRLIRSKSGIDLGEITDLIALRRGASGRVSLLRIIGDKLTVDVGKELEIRRWLSETHLYSSAFIIDRQEIASATESDGLTNVKCEHSSNCLTPRYRFTLRGAGWGHGVGLCQIGAAVMGAKGYGYRQILSHYDPGSEITKRY